MKRSYHRDVTPRPARRPKARTRSTHRRAIAAFERWQRSVRSTVAL